ncbi:MAG: EscU/YscU/HrcU family type III secretion system export apparatus switch protein [Acidobacteriaceae bacterium]|nr:EscU/YscU/HrcU family type III secretion system export apparatus switch protein [Acidobacteriaceae bacterium]
MSEQRTEKATPQRKKKAREQGDVVRSRELLSSAGLLVGLLALAAASSAFTNAWRQCYGRCVRLAVSGSFGLRELMTVVRTALLPAAVPIAMVMGASLLTVLAVGFAQSGGLALNSSALVPKLERLSPASHIKQLFSVRALVRLAKSLLPALVVAWMGWAVLGRMMTTMPVLSLARLPETFGAAYGLGLKAAWVMVAWAGVDYAVEWRAWNQRLKMSKQEMREEVKDAMGNPQIKGKIRAMQRTMARRKAKVDMRLASVVITNPTHYAVALEFSFEEMSAPKVLTKGRDLIALDIRAEAKAAGVPIVENPPLARSLYRAVEPGQSIPYDLYSAVAGILAFLFREQQEQKMRDERHAQQARAERQREQQLGSSPMRFEGGM